jgi:hypothetical protein
MTVCLSFIAWAIIDAMMERRSTSSVKLTSSSKSLSALKAPMASLRLDGNADETDVLLPDVFPGPRAVQEMGFLGNSSARWRAPGLDDPPGDSLAEPVPAFFPLLADNP